MWVMWVGGSHLYLSEVPKAPYGSVYGIWICALCANMIIYDYIPKKYPTVADQSTMESMRATLNWHSSWGNTPGICAARATPQRATGPSIFSVELLMALDGIYLVEIDARATVRGTYLWYTSMQSKIRRSRNKLLLVCTSSIYVRLSNLKCVVVSATDWLQTTRVPRCSDWGGPEENSKLGPSSSCLPGGQGVTACLWQMRCTDRVEMRGLSIDDVVL